MCSSDLGAVSGFEQAADRPLGGGLAEFLLAGKSGQVVLRLRRRDRALTRKVQILFYLVAVRKDYYATTPTSSTSGREGRARWGRCRRRWCARPGSSSRDGGWWRGANVFDAIIAGLGPAGTCSAH